MGKIIAVQAMGSSVIRNCAVEDSVVNTFFSANGAAVTFVLSDAAAAPLDWEQTSKENRTYPTCGDIDFYRVSGIQGCLGFSTIRISWFLNGTEANWWKPCDAEALMVTHADPLRC